LIQFAVSVILYLLGIPFGARVSREGCSINPSKASTAGDQNWLVALAGKGEAALFFF